MNQSLSAILLLSAALTGSAAACDRVEYAEAKGWSTAKLQRAYCADSDENLARTIAQIEGKMGYARNDRELCTQQTALYERLLEARGKDLPKPCK